MKILSSLRTNNFLPLSQILKDELGKLAEGRFAPVWDIEQRWKNLVGQSVAQNTRVLYVKNGILHVGVQNSAWMCELGFMKTEILEKLKAQLPDTPVAEIKLKLMV